MKPKFYYEEFSDFWKVICERNPDKVDKIVLMSFDELKDWTRQVFFGAQRLKHKKKRISFCRCDTPKPEISTNMKFMYCEKCQKWIRPKKEKSYLELRKLIHQTTT